MDDFTEINVKFNKKMKAKRLENSMSNEKKEAMEILKASLLVIEGMKDGFMESVEENVMPLDEKCFSPKDIINIFDSTMNGIKEVINE